YHCHVTDVLHVQMGMYGLVVVKSHNGTHFTAWPGGPAYHDYRNWLMSEVDTFWHNHIPVHDTIADTMHIDPYHPSHFLINGRGGSQLFTDDSIKVAGSQNETIFIRTANIGYTTNRIIIPSWLGSKVVDSDGRALPAMVNTDTVYVMPGERFGLFLEPLVQGIDTILVEYLDMNTGEVLHTSKIPVNIDGIFGIKESHSFNQLKLFPNPTTAGRFSLINEGKHMVSKVEVYNATGALVFAQKINSRSREIQVEFEPASSGVFVVCVTGEKNRQASLRLVINH
ncbi:MAG TPA: T9SS type A sorting domain-containing protein, partial [Flavobacteriales bacterium]|nr:T9SS type A sorting domain-containing protein [Flavobacteriales bacterium]